MPDMRRRLTEQGLILDVGMDGYAVPQFSPEVYRSGKEAAVPMIFGSNGRYNPGIRVGTPSDTPEQRQAAFKRCPLRRSTASIPLSPRMP